MSFEFESDDEDASMPELGSQVSVEDLCCDADDESSRQDGDKPQPRRLTLQQRRRLNLYSKPASLHLPAASGGGGGGSVGTGVGGASGSVSNWAIHDTPTIHEEDSGVGSVQSPEANSASSLWPKAVNLVIQSIKHDPWRSLSVASASEEEALRHKYNPHKRQWVQDRIKVKVDSEPFDRGAMRECFRLKKMSNFSTRFDNWNSRACNYVAKKYIEDVDPSVYYEDVRLQMNAKLWAVEYNRHHPPKKVDIMQMSVIEFINRDGSPLYHLEHHIEGDYVKYNSNSGFVDDKLRSTPQALSHFTFERSGHQLIIVDIQGVGDIYTDPQIHTADGTEYGDGNLGIRGMALFFQSHSCNEICRRLGLSAFDLAPSEAALPLSPMQTDSTCVRGDILTVASPQLSPPSIFDSGCSTDEESFEQNWAPRRRRNTSGDFTPQEEDLAALSDALKKRERPSCAMGNIRFSRRSRSRSDSGNSDLISNSSSSLPGMPERRFVGPILGKIHHEVAMLYEAGRFAAEAAGVDQLLQHQQQQLDINWKAVAYHEELSAELGVIEAAVNLARVHLGLPSDCLQNAPSDLMLPDSAKGLDYLATAAKLGDRSAMLQLANAYDCGQYSISQDWDKAAHYYHQALSTLGQQDREGGYDCCLDTPNYKLSARLAELYANGGYGLDADKEASYECYSEAADVAMQHGNGKLAAKYYALAEEVAADIPE